MIFKNFTDFDIEISQYKKVIYYPVALSNELDCAKELGIMTILFFFNLCSAGVFLFLF